jgi:PhnB protein
MKVHLYLTFDGKCAQAFDHYKDVFGCDIASKLTWGDNPEKDQSTIPLSDEKANQIMHMSMPLTKDFELMGCDMPPEGTPGGGCPMEKKFVFGDNLTINLQSDSKEHADKLLAALASKGGTITMPMADTWWGYFGMCKDPFGVNWMMNFPLEDNKDEKKEGECGKEDN